MKSTAFTIAEKIKDSPDYLDFPLRPVTLERPTPSPDLEDVLEEYKGYIKQRREKERYSEFPAGVSFIEPPIRLRVKTAVEDQMPPSRPGRTDIPQEKGVEFKPIRLKDLLKKRGNFALIADSGLGKTTLLKEIQYQIVTEELSTAQIPIYFHLRDLLGVFSLEALRERIKDSFPQELSKGRIDETVATLFRQERLLFLLDGLDQVEDKSNLPTLLGRYGLLSSHWVVLAGRPYIYAGLQNPGYLFC